MFALYIHAYILQLHCFGLQLGQVSLIQFPDSNLYWFSLTMGDVDVPVFKIDSLKVPD